MNVSDQLIDDRRLQLDSSNMFSRCRQNGLPKMDQGVTGKVSFKTSFEIQSDRLAAKRAS